MEEERRFIHDLSTPLTVLQISLSRAVKAAESDPEDLKKLLDRCNEQSKKLIKLVEDRSAALRAQRADGS